MTVQAKATVLPPSSAAALRAIRALLLAHASHAQLDVNAVELRVCSPNSFAGDAPLRVFGNLSTSRPALVSGIFFTPSPRGKKRRKSDRRAAQRLSDQRKLLLPDQRLAAGDLASHLVVRHRIDEGQISDEEVESDSSAGQDGNVMQSLAGGKLSAPDGSIFAFPSWAKVFIDEPAEASTGLVHRGARIQPLLFQMKHCCE